MSRINELLDCLIEDENKKLERLVEMKKNKGAIEFLKGGTWVPLTDEDVDKYGFSVDILRLNIHYLVKTNNGIRILNAEEYATYMGDTVVLYQGCYEACKNFIKV